LNRSRQIQNVRPINLHVLESISETHVHRFRQSCGRIDRHSAVYAVSRIPIAPPNHLRADLWSTVPHYFVECFGPRRRRDVCCEIVLLHNQSARPRRTCCQHRVACDVAWVWIKTWTVSAHCQGYILVGKRCHGRVNDLPTGIQHFGTGVSSREPIGHIGGSVWHSPVFTIRVGKACRNDLDGGIVCKMRSQRRYHCVLFCQVDWVPKDRDRG